MICIVCGKPVVPQGGYFKTQLHDGKKITHVACKPVFFYQKSEEKQEDMFIPQPSRREQK